MIHCSLWDRYPSLGTIITSDRRGALAVKSHHLLNDKVLVFLLITKLKPAQQHQAKQRLHHPSKDLDSSKH